MTRRCLILSHGFNMDGRAASQTITDKLPYFLNKRWQLFVLSAVTGKKDSRFSHEQLFAWGPAAFRFDFRHWCAQRLGRGLRYRLFTTLVSTLISPLIVVERALTGLSSQWSWTIPATIRGYIWIKRHNIDLIYSTGGAWSAHLAAWWLKKLTHVRWIAEIHDPLVERISEDDDGLSPRSSREARFRQHLEQKICMDSDACWWFTEGALCYARKRNPALGSKGFYILPGAPPPETRARYCRRTELHIAHFGSLSQSRSLGSLIQSLAQFYTIHPKAVGKIRLHAYGSELDSESKRVVQTSRLTGSVIEHGRLEYNPDSGQSGRDQITALMQTSDFLLLLHGDYETCAEYIPSKLYEYWWANRPVLAITHRNPQLDKLICSISPLNFVCHVHEGNTGTLRLLEFAWQQWNSGSIDQIPGQSPPLTPKDAVDTIERSVTHTQ